MKIYLVWNHDPGYMTSSLEKVFTDGKAAGKYVREMNTRYDNELAYGCIRIRPWLTVQVREVDE